jgi:hypothetical protein
MGARTHYPRILAIDLRLRRFGYAVFEGPKRLLDWGVYFFPPVVEGGTVVVTNRVGDLMRLFTPSAVVVKKADRGSAGRGAGISPILKAIQSKSSARSTPVCLIRRKDVRQAFRIFRGNSKYENAVVLTRIFPDLLWKLPPKRKFYQGEHPRMIVFDAVAVGFTYWQLNGTQVPPPE